MVIRAKKSEPKSTSLAIMGADHLPEEDDEDDEFRYISDELVAKPNETSSRITNWSAISVYVLLVGKWVTMREKKGR